MRGKQNKSSWIGVSHQELVAMFAKEVCNHPTEAKSHFNIVDPGTWRFDVAGQLRYLGSDWDGPYKFRLDGVEYEAYGLKARLAQSQIIFLEDMGVQFTHSSTSRILPNRILCFLFCGWVLLIGGVCLCFLIGESKPVAESHAPRKSNDSASPFLVDLPVSSCGDNRGKPIETVASPIKLTKPTPTSSRKVAKRDEQSVKERARRAFRSTQWKLALDLVDQLSDEEADPELRYYIGLCYKNGYDLEQNYSQAVFWFKTSAEGGNASAQYEMGLAYENGRGVEKDQSRALEWYTKAAKHGNPNARFSLQRLHGPNH